MLPILAAAAAFATPLPEAGPSPEAAPVTVTYEKPRATGTSASFDVVGVETFDEQPHGDTKELHTDFGGNGRIFGTYERVTINHADYYGGVGGMGGYAMTWDEGGYNLYLASKDPQGVNYFGYWLSALDPNNRLDFYNAGELIYSFSSADLPEEVRGEKAYHGNPEGKYEGSNDSEIYAFVNFHFNGSSFDRLHFWQQGGGGYESDNHTVGFFQPVPQWEHGGDFGTVSPVPEPTTWALMLSGFAMVGMAVRRRRFPTAVID